MVPLDNQTSGRWQSRGGATPRLPAADTERRRCGGIAGSLLAFPQVVGLTGWERRKKRRGGCAEAPSWPQERYRGKQLSAVCRQWWSRPGRQPLAGPLPLPRVRP